MNKTLVLLKFSVRNMFSFGAKGDKKNGSPRVKAFLYLFAGVYFTGFSAVFAYFFSNGLDGIGLISAVPTLYYVVITIATIFTSIFSARGYLFQSRDIEALFSLPIKHFSVMLSKFFQMYLFNMIFVLILLSPMNIVFFCFTGFSVAKLFGMILTLLFSPVLPMIIGTLISFVVTYATRNANHKGILSIVFVTGFLVVYFAGIMNATKVLAFIQENIVKISNAINKIYPLTRLYVKSLEGKIVNTLLFSLINIASMVIFLPLISIKFVDIVSAMKRSNVKSNFKMTDEKVNSPFVAAFKKEVNKFFSTTNYLLNSGIGMILVTLFSVASLFTGESLIADVFGAETGAANPISGEILVPLVAIIFAFCAAMTTPTASAISLEGTKLWIYKSSPITERTIFDSKICFNIVLIVPLLIVDAVLVSIGCGFDALEAFGIAFPACMIGVLVSHFGLLINLVFPKLEFTNETVVIKQSASVLLTIFFSFAMLGAASLVYYYTKPASFALYALFTGIVLGIISLVIRKIIFTWGVKKFRLL